MVFGRIRSKRKKKEARLAEESADRERRDKDIAYETEREAINTERARRFAEEGATADERVQRDRERMNEDRSLSRQYAEELLNRDVEGISPERRKQMQDQANMSLSRDLQNAERRLISSQGRRGMRGGIAYAQRADLARMGQEARAGIQSDLNRLDYDAGLKRLAAMLAMEQGERSILSSQYDRARADINAEENRRLNQMALDMLIRRYGA